MTADQFSAQLKRSIGGLNEAADKAVRMGALSTNALVSKRVYEDGFLSSQKREYKSKQYKAKRQKRGFETAFVNLTFEGTLKKDTENSVTQIKKGTYAAGIKNAANSDKLDSINRRYEKPYSLINKEAKAFTEVVNFEMKRYING